MFYPRFRIRTLMIAVASAAIGVTTAPRRQFGGYISYMDLHHNSPMYWRFSLLEVLVMAAVIGAVVHLVLVGILRIVPKMSLRQRTWGAGVLGLLMTAEIVRERWTDRAVYCRERAYQVEGMIEFLEEIAARRQAAGDDADARRCRTQASQFRSLWVSYDRSARYPWLSTPPESPPPR